MFFILVPWHSYSAWHCELEGAEDQPVITVWPSVSIRDCVHHCLMASTQEFTFTPWGAQSSRRLMLDLCWHFQWCQGDGPFGLASGDARTQTFSKHTSAQRRAQHPGPNIHQFFFLLIFCIFLFVIVFIFTVFFEYWTGDLVQRSTFWISDLKM